MKEVLLQYNLEARKEASKVESFGMMCHCQRQQSGDKIMLDLGMGL